MELGSPSKEAVLSLSELCENLNNTFQFVKIHVYHVIFLEVKEFVNKEPEIVVSIPSTSTTQTKKIIKTTREKTNHEIGFLNQEY